MKIARIGPAGREKPAIIDLEGQARDLSAVIEDWTAATLSAGLKRIGALDPRSLPVIEPPFRYGPPIANVGKMICIGLNYRAHAEEAGMALPPEPPFFLKATSAIIGPDDDVVLPRGAKKGDWEVELGVVIGRKASHVTEAEAMDHVAGYCIVNDVSERELQLERGTQWTKGKSCDTFGPTGPWIVTADDVGDPHDLRMTTAINGVTMQDARTDDMIFTIPQLIAEMSELFTLHPGDIISTGTPGGVGFGMTPPVYLKPGDEMHLRIEGLGEQRQRVVAHR
ncbi:fumarylacetoacetate hydrolase family protein [Rhizorhabdus wittichii]